MGNIERHSKKLAYTRLVPSNHTCRVASRLLEHLDQPSRISYDTIQANIVSYGGGYNPEAEEAFRQFNRDHATPFMQKREGVQDPFQDSKVFAGLEGLATLPISLPTYLGKRISELSNGGITQTQATVAASFLTTIPAGIATLIYNENLMPLFMGWTLISMVHIEKKRESQEQNPEFELLISARKKAAYFVRTELDDPFFGGIDDVVTMCEATHNQFKNGSPI
jgi:hypothetical protein